MKLLPALLLAAALPLAGHAEDAPRCYYVEVAKFPIRYVGQSLEPAVVGSINDMPATMLVDTGAFRTFLTMNGAVRRDLGLQISMQKAEGVGGMTRLHAARIDEMSLGPSRNRRPMTLPVLADAHITDTFDAILGASFLLQTDLEVDLGARQLRQFRSRGCDTSDLAIWKEEAVVLPFERSQSLGPNPHFIVTVNGVKLDAVIDTGAQQSTMTLRGARRAGIDLNGPDVKYQGTTIGVGAGHAKFWRATFKTVEIGNEGIRNAEIDLMESQGDIGTDMLLGQDFLRSHRVLFAMSQKKLYIAYLGGTPFARHNVLQPWQRAEAEGGNADAQYVLSQYYEEGRGVARDPVQAQSWLDKAVAGGQPNAKLQLGRQHLLAGRVREAIPQLRAGLDQLPADRFGALWLYTARLRNGEAALAGSELQAQAAKQKNEFWPEPILDFYLGKLDAAGLLRAAGTDPDAASERTCEANRYMAEWHAARGDQARADTLMATLPARCDAPAPATNKDNTPS